MTALVTSRETAAGGAAINDARREAGFEALALLEVGLVGGGGGEEGGKLSSSALRDAEARRRTDGDGDADEVNTKG
jgi:pantetheine-phosphate adenylyltransferase